MTKKRLQCCRDQEEKNMISDMKRKSLNICLILPILFFTHFKPVSPGVYNWKRPTISGNNNIYSTSLFEGSAFEMEWLQMNAGVLMKSGKPVTITVPNNEEHLYIIKRGQIELIKGDSSFTLPKGSIAVLPPGQTVSVQNKQTGSCEFYVMKYRKHFPGDKKSGEKERVSIIKNWNDVEFKPHDRGGVRTFFEQPTTLLKRLEMHVTTLNAGLKSHAPHTHVAKEIIVMVDGETEMLIGEKTFKGKEGAVYFMESNILHGITNVGTTPCTYFAIQFE